ncbi:hypothetical protein BJ508DRAFT_419455 [Ascobolus immersus RN42]|uniref:Uncharacterized protein n=1 Tax=Ascobolus immersus RN42 TaxID=1160509 RepID=A0A3N4HS12_ASCIM|nr:hypothetical protein BJ508DRAFT_419455 [Ascobolus immersus RN42]
MLAQSLRVASRPLTRLSTRTFTTTISRRADLIQDLYVRELKAFKPAPVSASDAEGVVKSWVAPKPAAVPDVASFTNELAAYETSEVEVEGQAEGVEGQSAVVEEDWFEEEEAFGKEEEAKH